MKFRVLYSPAEPSPIGVDVSNVGSDCVAVGISGVTIGNLTSDGELLLFALRGEEAAMLMGVGVKLDMIQCKGSNRERPYLRVKYFP